jgi:sRNA-binding carbon storage regulator CsrA
MMPTIKRKLNEGIRLAGDIIVTVRETSRYGARLHVKAPADTLVELVELDGSSKPLSQLAAAVAVHGGGQAEK